MSKLKFAVEIAQEQLNKGNSKFLQEFLDNNVSNILLAEELTRVRQCLVPGLLTSILPICITSNWQLGFLRC